MLEAETIPQKPKTHNTSKKLHQPAVFPTSPTTCRTYSTQHLTQPGESAAPTPPALPPWSLPRWSAPSSSGRKRTRRRRRRLERRPGGPAGPPPEPPDRCFKKRSSGGVRSSGRMEENWKKRWWVIFDIFGNRNGLERDENSLKNEWKFTERDGKQIGWCSKWMSMDEKWTKNIRISDEDTPAGQLIFTKPCLDAQAVTSAPWPPLMCPPEHVPNQLIPIDSSLEFRYLLGSNHPTIH